MGNQFCFPLGLYLEILVAFIIEKPRIVLKTSRGVSFSFALSVFKPQPGIEWCFLWCAGPPAHSLARCLGRAFAYLWGAARNGEKTLSLPLWMLVVAVGTARSASHLVAEGWGLGVRGPVSLHRVGSVWACSPRAFWKQWAHPGAAVAPAPRSLRRACSVDPTPPFSGKSTLEKALWVQVRI